MYKLYKNIKGVDDAKNLQDLNNLYKQRTDNNMALDIDKFTSFSFFFF